MTYIIAEPCIDIKDLSCVDVCPVDCIHEFGRILIIDPEECIDCFAPTEQLSRRYGLRTFAELENQSCRVLTDDGFKPAVVKRFRRKPLVKLELAPAFEERDRYGGTRLTTRNISRFRRIDLGDADARLVPGRRPDGPTRSRVGRFRAGDAAHTEARRRDVPPRRPPRARLRRRSWNKVEIRSGEHLHYVQLYGERVARFRDFFEQLNFSPCLDVHPGYAGTGVVRSCVNLKQLLPETADAEYIAGFVDGWLAADGDPVKAGSWRLRSTDHEALAWLEAVAPYRRLRHRRLGRGELPSRRTSASAAGRSAGSTSLRVRCTGGS